jgi:hypothetical protein
MFLCANQANGAKSSPLRSVLASDSGENDEKPLSGGWGHFSTFRNEGARVTYPGKTSMGSANPMTRHDWFILVTMVGLPLCLFLYALAALYADLDKVIIKFWWHVGRGWPAQFHLSGPA